MDLGSRFNEFQCEAVEAICSDFRGEKAGRYLLVIPTGGGKTFTAAKAVNKLYDACILTSVDRVLWVAHRDYLLQQAKDAFKKVSNSDSWRGRLIFKTIHKSADCVADPAVKLIVIDEAHHAAAPSYQPFFTTGKKGILGLTATPSRHDKQRLDFDRESFSIGFPDLIEKGLIILPQFISLDTDMEFKFEGFTEDDLDGLNVESRNQYIIKHLLENSSKYKKIAIFVGSKKHAVDLYELMKSKAEIGEKYESISYVLGDENSRGQIRSDFIDQEKAFNRSIIINVDVLTEGYDDPSINTVIMARPTRSKLFYMQAVGRALRFSDNDAGKSAYIVEVTDRLPNIRYKIDNRWLFSEISDELEPDVYDRPYGSEEELRGVVCDLFSKNPVFREYIEVPDLGLPSRLGILLFRVYTEKGDKFIPLLLDKEKRLDFLNLFNYISEHAVLLANKNYNYKEFFITATRRCKIKLDIPDEHKKFICDAARNAHVSLSAPIDQKTHSISYYSLRYKRPDEPEALLEFLHNVVNADQMKAQIMSRQYSPGSFAIKLPLPLGNYVGKILRADEFSELQLVYKSLQSIKMEFGHEDHSSHVATRLSEVKIPIESKFHHAVVELVRTEENYYLDLKEM